MRRKTMIVVALLASAAVVPQDVNARPRLPGLLGVITAPIGAILGAGRGRGSRLAHHRSHAGAASHRPAAAVAATAAVPAVAAATSATASTPPEPVNEPAQPTIVGTTQPGKPAVATSDEPVSPRAASARAEGSPSVTSVSTPAAPAPQRSAALATPTDEIGSRTAETPTATKPAASHLGLVGPLTWPTALEDVVGFALWPEQYGEQLRTHGITDVLGAVFVSPAALAAKAHLKGAQAKAEDAGAASAALPACSQTKNVSVGWPAAELERALALTPAQRPALDQLKAALSNAIAAVGVACRDTTELSPVERLQVMQGTLWAVHDAVLLLRAPLASFYDSLSDEQKRKLSGPATEGSERLMSRNRAARMCGIPSSLDSSARQVERSLQVTKPQRASLDALNKKSFEMGQFLMASCLKPVPATPAERLDDAADRLTAVLFAASNVGPAVNDFYAQLSDEQKTKLKTSR